MSEAAPTDPSEIGSWQETMRGAASDLWLNTLLVPAGLGSCAAFQGRALDKVARQDPSHPPPLALDSYCQITADKELLLDESTL